MKQPRLYYCDHHVIPLPAGHRFPSSKYALLRQQLETTGLFDFAPAPLASPEAIRLVHEPSYVHAFLAGTLDTQTIRRIGFPWSEGLVLRTLASVGGTLQAARDALASGWSGGLAGGTHHASRAEGSGFCVFNDVAVAIAVLRQEEFIGRAAVLDLDVHQGDGTALIYEHDPSVLTISVHGSNNFPFRKQRSKIDVALGDGTEDGPYLQVVNEMLKEVEAFEPDLLFYQSGVDGLKQDTLGRLSLSHAGLQERDRRVFTFCSHQSLPCVVTLGGGYAQPIELTVEAHANTFTTAARVFCPS